MPDICEFTLKTDGIFSVGKLIKATMEICKNLSNMEGITYSMKQKSFLGMVGKAKFVVRGKAAHGSVPHHGVNAVSHAISALDGVVDDDFVEFYNRTIGTTYNGEKLGCYAEDEYGKIAVNVGLCHYEKGDFEVRINSRLPFTTDTPTMVEQIKNTIGENVKVDLKSTADGFKMDENSKMIKALMKAYSEVTGDTESKPICSAGGTYAREFKNCVAFGPEMNGYGEMIIHEPNERISLSAIKAIFDIYKEITEQLEIKAAEHNIRLSVKGADSLPSSFRVTADKHFVGQVLVNLIANSINYGKDGGSTRIRFRDMADKVLVEVEDTGIGIPKEDMPRIFERFYRVDKGRSRGQGGTGLGLAIVKHIVVAHGERITVRSELGVGTTFAFALKKK